MTQTLFPAADPRTPIPFLTIDELAAHLMRQRPQRRLVLRPVTCSRGEDQADFPALSVFAIKPADLRDFDDDPTGGAEQPMRFQNDWLGFAAGDQAADPERMAAALQRIRSAGGLAA